VLGAAEEVAELLGADEVVLVVLFGALLVATALVVAVDDVGAALVVAVDEVGAAALLVGAAEPDGANSAST